MRRAALLLAVLPLAGCVSPDATKASCDRPSKLAVTGYGPEVSARGQDAQLHGLVFARGLPLRASEKDLKIVWRMTGSGPLTLAAYDARGRKVALAWGPEEHGGSTYHRPGDEWGSGYRFAAPGCYRLTARRTVGRAEVWLRIRA
jgi:hypothetical protein